MIFFPEADQKFRREVRSRGNIGVTSDILLSTFANYHHQGNYLQKVAS